MYKRQLIYLWTEKLLFLQRRFIYDDCGAFCFQPFHNSLDGALAEVIGVGFHRETVDTYGYFPAACRICIDVYKRQPQAVPSWISAAPHNCAHNSVPHPASPAPDPSAEDSADAPILSLIHILFACYKNNTFILLHYFTKKTKKLPQKELEQALRNLNNFKERNG